MINIISDEEIFIIYFVQGQLVKFCIGVGVTLTKSKVKRKERRITDKFLYLIGHLPRVSVEDPEMIRVDLVF